MSAIETRYADGIARIALARAAVHNAFDDALIAELTAAFEAAGADPAVRVVVLTGDGTSFSAGADLGWMRRMAQASEAANRDDARRLARLMRTLDELPKPTIARVNGAAFGGGVGLIACCDIAIGIGTAKFGLTETKLGLVPAVISPYVIAAIGARAARRLFLTAEMFSAAEAHRLGLLHRVVESQAQLDEAVSREIALLLAAGPGAVTAAKLLVHRVARDPGADDLDESNAELIARLRVSPEGQEGLAAFLEKRKPAWAS